LPEEHQPIGVLWVYKKKINAEEKIDRYKVELITKGYRQNVGIDYDKVFALVTRMEIIQLLISKAAQFKWPTYQNVVQPHGYMKAEKEMKVLKLKKALYSLK
jgi:Reverse transcriptase (RNA-dependent DNA polymerase)